MGGAGGGKRVHPGVGFYLSIVWVLIGYSSLSYVTALLLRPIFRKLDENA